MHKRTQSRAFGGLIIDGVTGAGKSTILGILAAIVDREGVGSDFEIFTEEQTCGEFWDELAENPTSSDEYKTRLLAAVVNQVEAGRRARRGYRFILERAHYSYYAALPEWRLYDDFDRRLALSRPLAILLDIDDDVIAERSLYRADRSEGNSLRKLQDFGGERRAIAGLRATQDARKTALERSRIPYRIVNTTDRAWQTHAETIWAAAKDSPNSS